MQYGFLNFNAFNLDEYEHYEVSSRLFSDSLPHTEVPLIGVSILVHKVTLLICCYCYYYLYVCV